VAGSSEAVITTSGGLAEAETSGMILNIIPRDGGNQFRGSFYASGANGSMQSSNYTEELKQRGLGSPAELMKIYDVNPQGGGPILKDRLWFYWTERFWGNDTTIPGMWFNKNAGDPTKWTFDPDLARPAFTDSTMRTHVVNLTWQATLRNKLTLYWSEQYSCERCVGGGSSTQLGATPRTPESLGIFEFSPSRVQQATYTAPVSNRFLIEAGFGTYRTAWGSGYRDPVLGTMSGETDNTYAAQLVQITEQGGSLPGLIYRGPGTHNRNNIDTRSWRRPRHTSPVRTAPSSVTTMRGCRTETPPTSPMRCGQTMPIGSTTACRISSPSAARSETSKARETTPGRWTLRAGYLDPQAADPAGRHPLRPHHHLAPGYVLRWHGVHPSAARHPVRRESAGLRAMERHKPSDGDGLRPVRDRQDGRQAQPGQVRGGAVEHQ
jgi:hypothetical protein